jgi:hypothetical protein
MFRHHVAIIRCVDVNHYIALLNFENIIKYRVLYLYSSTLVVHCRSLK